MTTETIDIPVARLANLRAWNLVLTMLHLAQAVLIIVMAGDFAITITSNFPEGPPGTRLGTPASFFDLPVGPAVALFLLLAAVDHGLTATVWRDRYETGLRSGINRFRWVEYSFSASVMPEYAEISTSMIDALNEYSTQRNLLMPDRSPVS